MTADATVRVPTPPATPNYFVPQSVTKVEYGKMRFLITDRPNTMFLEQFAKELEKHHTRAIVRVCEPTYESQLLREHGIEVMDWQFSDGQVPPKEVIDKWLRLLKETFKGVKCSSECIAVHCVAGLGRAPLLVAIALLEAGMDNEDVVNFIRSHRRGALNERQLEFVRTYQSKLRLKKFGRQNSLVEKIQRNEVKFMQQSKRLESCSIM